MQKIATLIVGIVIGALTFGATAVFASTPKPSGYCTKKEIGLVKHYTSPAGTRSYDLKCTVVPTQKWKKVG